MQKLDLVIPDLGDFDQVPVVEVFVARGDQLQADDPILALESDKASLEIPSTHAGTVQAMHLKVGDMVSPGTPMLSLTLTTPAAASAAQSAAQSTAKSTAAASAIEPDATAPTPAAALAAAASAASSVQPADKHAQLLVLGGGPGGYTAAFRAADLGLKVILVERYARLGGVCLNVGCIPSKALLHVAHVLETSHAATDFGVTVGPATIDLAKLRNWKSALVDKLTQGLALLAKKRRVEVVHGQGEFTSPQHITVTQSRGDTIHISFDQAIIATGSQSIDIPGLAPDARMMNSTRALLLEDIPKKLLIIGGGIIGLELATVYRALGSQISVVEMTAQIMPGADPDLLVPLNKKLSTQYENIWTNTKVVGSTVQKNGIKVEFEGHAAPTSMRFDRVLVAVGRRPNGHQLNAAAAGVEVSAHGFIAVDSQQRTNLAHIFAIGDIVGQPMLAHKAVHEGKVAAEVAAGHRRGFDARVIPSVAYTDPEVAWVGVTETEAKAKQIAYDKGSFPWAASGRSLSQGSGEGVTKLLFDPDSRRLIGAGITGSHAGDLIAAAALAIEMNADAVDIALTVHPHPTLAETLGFAAEVFDGSITDLYLPKRAKPHSAP